MCAQRSGSVDIEDVRIFLVSFVRSGSGNAGINRRRPNALESLWVHRRGSAGRFLKSKDLVSSVLIFARAEVPPTKIVPEDVRMW